MLDVSPFISRTLPSESLMKVNTTDLKVKWHFNLKITHAKTFPVMYAQPMKSCAFFKVKLHTWAAPHRGFSLKFSTHPRTWQVSETTLMPRNIKCVSGYNKCMGYTTLVTLSMQVTVAVLWGNGVLYKLQEFCPFGVCNCNEIWRASRETDPSLILARNKH